MRIYHIFVSIHFTFSADDFDLTWTGLAQKNFKLSNWMVEKTLGWVSSNVDAQMAENKRSFDIKLDAMGQKFSRRKMLSF